MIPKKIHYCWLSGEKIPSFLKKCMDTWRQVMPEYEYVLWDKEKFKISSVPFYNEAFAAKRWASAADYIRLYALYTEGGIYLDTDVIVRKKFDDLLKYDFFAPHEWWEPSIQENNTLSLINSDGTLRGNILQRMYGVGIQAATFGSVQGHPLLKDLLDWHNSQHFPPPSQITGSPMPTAPDVYAFIARKYGFRYTDIFQELDSNIAFLPSSTFPNSTGKATKDSYAVHLCIGSIK
jgi:mannosyltransferase OCH1-like enzyme